MNRHEIFNTVIEHLIAQGHRACDDSQQTFLYYAPNGDKCAVGCLIPEYDYSSDFEEKDVSLVTDNILELDPLNETGKMLSDNLLMLTSLQSLHDNMIEGLNDYFWERVNELAFRYDIVSDYIPQKAK